MVLPELIAVDWGTSALRGARLDPSGQVLEEKSAPLGILNVHGSLLPKYRGAAPIAL